MPNWEKLEERLHWCWSYTFLKVILEHDDIGLEDLLIECINRTGAYGWDMETIASLIYHNQDFLLRKGFGIKSKVKVNPEFKDRITQYLKQAERR